MKEGEEKMADSGFSTSDAVLTAAMSGGSFGNRGGYNNDGMWGGGGGIGGAPYASLSAIQHGLAHNSEKVEDINETNREVYKQGNDAVKDTLEGLQRDNQFTATNKQVTDGNGKICDRLNQIEVTGAIKRGDDNLIMFRELAAIRSENAACCCETQKEMLRIQMENQKCCCETQKLIIEENSKTREAYTHDMLAQARSENNVNATVGPLAAAMAAQTQAILAALAPRHHG